MVSKARKLKVPAPPLPAAANGGAAQAGGPRGVPGRPRPRLNRSFDPARRGADHGRNSYRTSKNRNHTISPNSSVSSISIMSFLRGNRGNRDVFLRYLRLLLLNLAVAFS